MKLSQQSLNHIRKLEKESLIGWPKYDRESLEVGIVHLGLGAFHRSHQAVYTENVLNLTNDLQWGICGVAFRNEELKQALNTQDGLYTNVICGESQRFQLIGSIKHALVAATQIEKVLAVIAKPSVKLISLTVTEKGYCLDEVGRLNTGQADIQHDMRNIHSPKTAIGILVAGFKHRFEHGLSAFNVLACDNLPENGTKLKQAVVALAGSISNDLARWIKEHALFPNTMVDCITPKTEPAIINAVSSALKYSDAVPVQREPFSQWVIEDLPGLDRPQWEEVGVLFTNDVAGFERAKLRILNGTHSALAYIGTLLGYETVYEAVSNEKVYAFLARLLKEEIIPSIEPPKGLDLANYADEILTRYKNPSIRHLLLQIACDGSQKIPVRTFEPICDNLLATKEITLLSCVVAAWIRFICVRVERGDELLDPKADELTACVKQFSGEPADDVKRFLSVPGIVPEQLRASQAFSQHVVVAYQNIDRFLGSLRDL